jgi:glyoxylase-like metal-dependent hydrolase (beta-lactamase superfamily II)/rhodanese-related sulfurtransferase
MLTFRQLFDPQSSTYTYLLADPSSRDAVLVDAVFDQVRRDVALLEELGLRLRWTIDTHVHADHVTGAWLLRESLDSQIAISRASGAEGADRYLKHGERVEFGARSLEVRATPGHTDGCATFVLDDRSLAFTGDALLIRGCGRTDFQQGSADALYRSVHEQIFSLPDDCLLYPGHDYRGLTVTSVGEEKLYNPRLGGRVLREDFIGYMSNLGLAHPKLMDIAVPANLCCGRPESDVRPDLAPTWAPLTYTFAGIWELQPHWLEEHASGVQIIDVREEEEFTGPLGHIRGAQLIPLAELGARAGELDRDSPLVTVCRSGARSAQATVLLRQAGFENVANLSGGMLRWRSQRFAVEGGKD